MKNKEKFIVSIEKDSDGSYIAYNIGNTKISLLGRGDTVAEAKADFENSMNEAISVLKDEGIPVPKEFLSSPVFKFDLSSLFEYYSMINVSAFARYVGINEALMRQYRKGNTYVSEKQLHKIENGIHRLGTELAQLSITKRKPPTKYN